MENNLIIVRQLPVIEEQLQKVKGEIQEKVNRALSLVCTDETYKEVKKVRSVLNAEFSNFEDKRKEVKRVILEPYESFETLYKSCISSTYKDADEKLKERISDVENQLKEEKHIELIEYFDEYKQSKGIDFIEFSDVGAVATLSSGKLLKKEKESIKKFIDGVESALELIETQDHKEEILVEYKNTLDVAKAITTVSKRREMIENERIARESLREEVEQKQRTVQVVDEVIEQEVLTAPVVIETPEVAVAPSPMLSAAFRATGTKAQLIALKKYMESEGIYYESI